MGQTGTTFLPLHSRTQSLASRKPKTTQIVRKSDWVLHSKAKTKRMLKRACFEDLKFSEPVTPEGYITLLRVSMEAWYRYH